MGGASRLDLFDKDALTAATSCRTETDHAEAQTARDGTSQPDQLCMTALITHTCTHTPTFSTCAFYRCICVCSSAYLGGY